ncbi:glycosyltransferase family 10 domain-containing protein [Capnocytophaga canis]|uniref:glycosyltransferase family 10 domain-containing protein n=1 Tax=Capnocytophaga canis TaxID=1848903 RepID=UPI00370D67A9
MIQLIRKLKKCLYWVFKEYKMYFLYKTNVKFYNYWEVVPERNWLYRFIKYQGVQKKINVFSVFGPLWWIKLQQGKKIFFNAENVHSFVFEDLSKYSDNCIDKVDLSLGFDYIRHDKYIRFPLWLCYFIKPEATYEEIKNKINAINSVSHRLSSTRNRFAVQISRHDFNGVRKKMIENLNKIEEVSCAGDFMKNTNELQTVFNDDKLSYLRKFKFNICPENSSTEGYVTEKIFESIMGGCIPIYWGGGNKQSIEADILNSEAFLYYEEGKENELLSRVYTLWTDKNAYSEFVQTPPFKESAADVIWSMLNQFKKELKRI